VPGGSGKGYTIELTKLPVPGVPWMAVVPITGGADVPIRTANVSKPVVPRRLFVMGAFGIRTKLVITAEAVLLVHSTTGSCTSTVRFSWATTGGVAAWEGCMMVHVTGAATAKVSFTGTLRLDPVPVP